MNKNANYPNFTSRSFRTSEELAAFVCDNEQGDPVEHVINIVSTSPGTVMQVPPRPYNWKKGDPEPTPVDHPWTLFYTTRFYTTHAPA